MNKHHKYTYKYDKIPKQFINRSGLKNINDDKIEEYFNQHNALSLIDNISENNKKSVSWYIDCGDDDYLYEGNSLIHILMRKKEIPHEYRVRDGDHNWTYWRTALPKVLEYISNTFHR